MTANNNNVVFFFVSNLKIVYYNKYYSSITIPWTREKKISCVTTYLKTKSLKTVQAKFHRKFNFNNYPQKSQIYHWIHKFQATVSVNNLKKKAENSISDRKLMAKCPDNMDVVRDSVWRNLKKSLQKHSQELSHLHALEDKGNQFLPSSSGLTFLKWYDCFLRLRWKMTWCNMNCH